MPSLQYFQNREIDSADRTSAIDVFGPIEDDKRVINIKKRYHSKNDDYATMNDGTLAVKTNRY